MTAKQRAFVREYQVDRNGTQAAIRAGYSSKTAHVIAHQLLKKNLVAAAVAKSTEKLEEKAGVSVAWVMERLKSNAERAMQAEAIVSRGGETKGEYVYSGAVANRALELLGKQIGMFIDRKEIAGAGGGPISFAALSNEEILKLGELLDKSGTTRS